MKQPKQTPGGDHLLLLSFVLLLCPPRYILSLCHTMHTRTHSPGCRLEPQQAVVPLDLYRPPRIWLRTKTNKKEGGLLRQLWLVVGSSTPQTKSLPRSPLQAPTCYMSFHHHFHHHDGGPQQKKQRPCPCVPLLIWHSASSAVGGCRSASGTKVPGGCRATGACTYGARRSRLCPGRCGARRCSGG
jgi:hypothetical protein